MIKRGIVLIVLVVPGFYGFASARVLASANGKICEDISKAPHHRVGIVLGCSPTTGRFKNPFFQSRMNMAARMFHAGKVDRLLVSGDNGRVGYDEPSAMAQALVERGVPNSAITKDFAGFRTLDTMVRAKKVFGVDEATIITDDFHLARSIYFANGAGIEALGVQCKSASNQNTRSVKFREVLARGLAVVDQEILHSQPKFLGRPEVIF